jgi:hypothetical protein
MTGPATVLVRLRARRPGAAPAGPRTARELLMMLGRLVLWLAIGLALIRGVGIMAAPGSTPAPRVKDDLPVAAWPNDAARAFAIEFATAYLTYDRSEQARELDGVCYACARRAACAAPGTERARCGGIGAVGGGGWRGQAR